MVNAFFSFLSFISGLLKWLLITVAVLICPIILMYFVFMFYYVCIKKQKLPKRKYPRSDLHYTKKRSALKRLYIDFPKRLVKDRLTFNPDSFDTYGVHVIAGEQGSGKSVTAMHLAKTIKERNPACKIASNISLNYQDVKIEGWQDIIANSNGEFGQIVILDEIQNWFNSNESRNFPVEMLTEITQQRKQRKCIIGTSQVFTRIAKPIREQITYLYRPLTIMGALTFVRVYKVNLTDDGTVRNMRMLNCYFFVHDDELRSCYDTYEKVERLTSKGFVPRSEQYSSCKLDISSDFVPQNAPAKP